MPGWQYAYDARGKRKLVPYEGDVPGQPTRGERAWSGVYNLPKNITFYGFPHPGGLCKAEMAPFFEGDYTAVDSYCRLPGVTAYLGQPHRWAWYLEKATAHRAAWFESAEEALRQKYAGVDAAVDAVVESAEEALPQKYVAVPASECQ